MPDINTVQRGTLLEPETVKELFSNVKGRSSLAVLPQQEPVTFNGNDYFVFSMDGEAAVVGESEAKGAGNAGLGKVTMRPVKLEYGARFSDEYLYGTEEKQLETLTAFADGAAKKFARALDIVSIYGVNPRTGSAVAELADKTINAAITATENSVTYTAADPEANIEDAVAMLGDHDVTGYALSKDFAAALSKLKVNGVRQYPEFALGANPGSLGGTKCDVNSTLSFGNGKDKAIVGDFANAYKWGYAKEIPLEVIEYGDPDNTSRDLKGHNEVYLRCEVYVGFAVLDKTAFAAVQAE